MNKSELKSKLLPDEILALTMYGEARGEIIEGQVAVANVIKNRFHIPNKYKTISDVCLEPLQFSCWNNTDPNLPRLLEVAELINIGSRPLALYNQCQYLAVGVIRSLLNDNTSGARFYMESHLFNTKRPKWATQAIKVKVIGNHTFFSLS